MKSPGRNELCPCGSGRKYKQCCLGNAEPAMTEKGRLAHVHNATRRAVYERVTAWSARELGRDWLEKSLDAFHEMAPLAEGEHQFLVPWLVYHAPREERRRRSSSRVEPQSPAERFLAEEGEALSPLERESLATYIRGHLSVWEARRVEPGVGVELFDLLTHEIRFVHEVRGTQNLSRWSVLLAAVVDHPEVSVFGGLHPHVLKPGQVERVLSIVRMALGVRKRVLKPVNLRAGHVQFALVAAWRDAVHAARRAALEPRMLQNTDGDPFLMCTDHFDILCRTSDLLDALEAIDGAQVSHTDEFEEVLFTRPGNKKHASLGNTIVGRAVVSGKKLLVQTNSEARANALRRRIEQAAGARLRFRLGERRDANDLLENPPPAARHPEPEPPAEMQAAMREVMERMRDAWVEERVPALSGRTPRHAAASPTLRPRLVALLKEFEMHEAARPAGERYDVGRLWRALGIDPLAPEAPGAAPRRPRARSGGAGKRPDDSA